MTWSGFESRIHEATLDLGATAQLESWVGDPALECGAGLDFHGQLDGRAVASRLYTKAALPTVFKNLVCRCLSGLGRWGGRRRDTLSAHR